MRLILNLFYKLKTRSTEELLSNELLPSLPVSKILDLNSLVSLPPKAPYHLKGCNKCLTLLIVYCLIELKYFSNQLVWQIKMTKINKNLLIFLRSFPISTIFSFYFRSPRTQTWITTIIQSTQVCLSVNKLLKIEICSDIQCTRSRQYDILKYFKKL